MTNEFRSGLSVGNKFYLGCWNKLVEVYDKDSFKLIATIDTKDSVRKMITLNKKYIICGEYNGYIEIINIETDKIIFRW